MDEVDVVIIGGGPVGLYLASLLAEELEVLVIERNRGFRKADSGLYSANLGRLLPMGEWKEHDVEGALIHSPGGRVLGLRKRSTAAHVVDRASFVKWLSRKAGCRRVCAEAREILLGEGVTVRTNKGDFRSKMLLGCDGANSVVRRHFGIRPKESVTGLTAITRERDDSRHVDIHLDKQLLGDGFLWRIPRGRSTEYGALGKGANFRLLEDFFGISDYERDAAPINFGYIRTHFPRTLLVGEAACQVKPWSGGGVVYGLTCARIASEVVLEAFRRNDFSEAFLGRYERVWKGEIGNAIRAGLFFRERFKGMNNHSLDRWLGLLGRIPMLGRLDMDFILGRAAHSSSAHFMP